MTLSAAHAAILKALNLRAAPLCSMAEDIQFDRNFAAVPGRVEAVAPNLRRVLAPNPGPFTFTGTCTYIIGEREVAILDPGPNEPAHIKALLDAVSGEQVAHILVTHTHRDHSPAAAAIAKATAAKIFAEGPHRAARALHSGETNPIEAGADREFSPDVQVRDGEMIEGANYALEAVSTPGHTANHLAFALKGASILFSGDHVMGWSTTIVAPPDGSMNDYVASLKKLKARPESLYFPGHGPPVRDAHAYVDQLIAHRAGREAAILSGLERASDIPTLVKAIYVGLDPRLTGAAALTVLAHLEDLVERGLVASEDPSGLEGQFRRVR
jgi:glyoxylase-like metal-dependent hydrolase (beta-lactamase superfamily II)